MTRIKHICETCVHWDKENARTYDRMPDVPYAECKEWHNVRRFYYQRCPLWKKRETN